MKPPRPPRFETRRAKELEAELFARARAWIPSWGMDDDERDFGRALLKIAARFSSEVAERLDRAGEKLRLGFLDWLAVPAEAARPARLPVVFKLADSARDAKPATALTRLQVEAAGASVILETETDMLVLPRQLQVLVGVDAGADAFFLPPPGLSSLAPLEPLPTQWQLKSFASAGATTLQLDPEQGLAVDMLIELGGLQYRITEVKKNIVTVEPPLTGDQTEASIATKVTAFMPFDGAARNRQEHALYIGHKELFNIEAAATIEIVGAKQLAEVAWRHWGKVHPADEIDWQPLQLASPEEQAKAEGLVLIKPKGSMEMLELVKGSESRWIRASVDTVTSDQPPLLVDAFEIRINCGYGAPPPPSADPSAEAMANTTPLVLDSVFFPFGKEPRQFDTFYLGSKEAFSKKGADVVLNFEMADTTFTALSAVRGGAFADPVLGGVALDGALYLLEVKAGTGVIGKFRERGTLRPPPADGNADVSAGVALDRRPQGRLPFWHDGEDPDGFLIAASVRDAVWVWRESSSDKDASRWIPFGAVPTTEANPTASISDIVYLTDTSTLVALRGGQLSVRKWQDAAPWTAVETKDKNSGDRLVLDAIVPILTGSANSLVTSMVAGMLGISNDKKLYQVTAAGICTPLDLTDVDAGVRPVGVLHEGDLFITFMRASQRNPVMFHLSGGGGEGEVELAGTDAKAMGFDAAISEGELNFVASVQLPSGGYLASWTAPVAGDIEPFRAEIPAGLGRPVGAPTAFTGRVVIPGTGGHVLTTAFDVSQRLERHADIVGEAVFTPGPPVFEAGDFLVREIPEADGTTDVEQIALTEALPQSKFSVAGIVEVGTTPDGEAYYLLEDPFSRDATGALYGFRSSETRSGTPVSGEADQLQLDERDGAVRVDSVLLTTTDGEAHRITALGASRVATLVPSPPAADSEGQVSYLNSVALSGRVSPFIRLDPTNADWDAALLGQAALRFPGASPVQHGKAFSFHAGTTHPLLIELQSAWTSVNVPGPGATFLLDASAGVWTRSLDDTATNPELSWEYWNGTGWWKLVVTRDETLNLKISGKLEFKVPLDLAPTDWSGRTNYWIRARLIGGDYGREKVSVAISKRDKITGIRHQTIERSTENIHPPSVVKLSISYEICESVLPAYVMTKDSGSLRDQSDANRTAGAKVEAFVPVAVLLGRLSGPPAAAAHAESCKPDCQCPSGTPPSAAAAAVASDSGAGTPASTSTLSTAPMSAATSAPAGGRAIYLGFDAPLLGEPINVLLLVEERPHDGFAPMTVEALIADRFVPVVVNDATRALGESGVLSMAFPVEATPRELFGRTLRWLRLTPAAGTSSADWKPKVLGAYLNGVWASAAETLTRELVGSSQGEPDLTLYLARPPVLRNTLELRVKEPLGEEERKALNEGRADQVLSAVENLPGDWVLWKRAIDPADEEPTARVYALDETTGEIRFGDGRHGRIPPVGRDSIVAFTYRRTEVGAADSTAASDSTTVPRVTVVPGNTITARTTLNLVSPIEGVEAVFAADQGAGGAPPEAVDRVLRYGVASLRHRERAVTVRDIEDLVLESSPDIAQARCFTRNGFVQLVVVMRGANPMPSAAQLRELHRLLVAEAPPALSTRQALRIAGPTLRRLRVDLRLRVASLDVAGIVGRGVRKQIIALFDTAIGGADEEGWALGENPNEADVAVALANVPRSEGIASVVLREITADGGDQPWPQSLKRNELARLEKDGVRIEFETVEVVA